MRDLEERTFTFESARRPTLPLTQNWLITRGCPREATEPNLSHGPRPADALTSCLEDRLRSDPEGRYTLLDSCTHNPGSMQAGIEVSVLLHDGHPDSRDRPYRVFLEETAPSFATYTVREGAFSSAEAAQGRLRERSTPLPLAPGPGKGTRRGTRPACRLPHPDPRQCHSRRTADAARSLSAARHGSFSLQGAFVSARFPRHWPDLRDAPEKIRDLALLELQHLVHGNERGAALQRS